jgi:hypothetical protein
METEMKKMTKSDQAHVLKLHAVAARYVKTAHRAKTWFQNTGTAMMQPGALTELLKASKGAHVEIAAIQAKYR